MQRQRSAAPTGTTALGPQLSFRRAGLVWWRLGLPRQGWLRRLGCSCWRLGCSCWRLGVDAFAGLAPVLEKLAALAPRLRSSFRWTARTTTPPITLSTPAVSSEKPDHAADTARAAPRRPWLRFGGVGLRGKPLRSPSAAPEPPPSLSSVHLHQTAQLHHTACAAAPHSAPHPIMAFQGIEVSTPEGGPQHHPARSPARTHSGSAPTARCQRLRPPQPSPPQLRIHSRRRRGFWRSQARSSAGCGFRVRPASVFPCLRGGPGLGWCGSRRGAHRASSGRNLAWGGAAAGVGIQSPSMLEDKPRRLRDTKRPCGRGGRLLGPLPREAVALLLSRSALAGRRRQPRLYPSRWELFSWVALRCAALSASASSSFEPVPQASLLQEQRPVLLMEEPNAQGWGRRWRRGRSWEVGYRLGALGAGPQQGPLLSRRRAHCSRAAAMLAPQRCSRRSDRLALGRQHPQPAPQSGRACSGPGPAARATQPPPASSPPPS